MFRSVIILSAIAGALCAVASAELAKSVPGSGENTTLSHPWTVALLNNNTFLCEGAIYSRRVVITAASCVYKIRVSFVQVRAGSSNWNDGGVLLNISAYDIHYGYDNTNKKNNIALLQLSSPLTFGFDIGNIPLTSSRPSNGASAILSGWRIPPVATGGFLSNELRFTHLNTIDKGTCLQSDFDYTSDVLYKRFCAFTDVCYNGAGLPLVSDGHLIGIAVEANNCRLGYAGIFTDISIYYSWIQVAAKYLNYDEYEKYL